MVLGVLCICEAMKAIAYISFQFHFGTESNFNSLWLFSHCTVRDKNGGAGKGLIPPLFRSIANSLLKETVVATGLPIDLCEFWTNSTRMGAGS